MATNEVSSQPAKGRFPWGCVILIILTFIAMTVFGLMMLSVFALMGDDLSTTTSGANNYKELTYQEGNSDEKIAILPIKGVITSQAEESALFTTVAATPREFYDMAEKAMNDDDVKAVVIDMDTPGGEVLASDLIYRRVKEMNVKKPVVVWIGNLGASGGYYISSGASEIIAHPSSITGSIGVITQVRNMDGLYEKLGIETKTFKSSQFKDNSALWGSDQSSDELGKIYQGIIDETYEEFVKIVAEGRNMDEAYVRKLADGRIYTGKQAKENGLVDENGFMSDAIVHAADLADLDKPSAVYYQKDKDLWGSLGLSTQSVLSGMGLVNILPKSMTTPGVYMYYMLEPVGSN